jgi:hypothetical protein
MTWLIRGTTMLEPPYLDLTEQRKRGSLPDWIGLRHLEEPFPKCIRSPRREGEGVPTLSIWAALQKNVLDRTQNFIWNTRTGIAKHAEAGY